MDIEFKVTKGKYMLQEFGGVIREQNSLLPCFKVDLITHEYLNETQTEFAAH